MSWTNSFRNSRVSNQDINNLEFVKLMGSSGFKLESETLAPKEYHGNPLHQATQTKCDRHFDGLNTKKFMLYKWRKTIWENIKRTEVIFMQHHSKCASVRDLNFFILNLCFTPCMFYTPVPVPVTRMEHWKGFTGGCEGVWFPHKDFCKS